MPAQVAIK